MIVFDIRCHKDHVFEAWYASGAAFEKLRAAGAIACPVCGSNDVAKALMAPNVQSSKTRGDKPATAPQAATAPAPETATAAAKPVPAKEATAEAYVMLAKMRDFVEKNSDDVGDKFPEEARKVHYGEVGPRNIRGQATPEEAEALHEEGIEFSHIPWIDRAEN